LAGGAETRLDEGRTLLDIQISYAELVDEGALEFISERQLRRWFAGRDAITVRETLSVRTHLSRKFWAIMRDEVVPERVLHQLAVDYADEFLRRVAPVYMDFRTRRALEAKQGWLDDRISIGDLQVAAFGAAQALVTVGGLDDKLVSDCASMVCQALAGTGEIAQRQAFYAFLGLFGNRSGRDWLLQQVTTRLGETPVDWFPADRPPPLASPAPPSGQEAAGQEGAGQEGAGQEGAGQEGAGQEGAADQAVTTGRAIAIDQNLPVGTVLAFAGELPKDLVPKGWLVCDGSTRLGDQNNYPELFEAIGYIFGAKSESLKEFNLPDLRGRFVRSTVPTASRRDERDPEWRDRFRLMPLGQIEANVGSYQGYGTAKPKKAFSITVDNLDIEKVNDAAGCGSTPAEYNSGSVSCLVTGGDAETRPDNKYVYFIIKAASLDKEKLPVGAPVGGVISFAGSAGLTPPPDSQWVRCTGTSVPRVGKYFELSRALGSAHGGDATNFNLPDYHSRGWFLRGVSELSNVDPERDKRTKAAAGGWDGNNVGTQQDWATAIPVHKDGGDAGPRLLRAKFDNLPTSNRGKLTDFWGWSLARLNTGAKSLTLNLGDSGDAETRPANVSVDFYIKYIRSQPDTDVPVGTIITVGRNLPANDFWLPCDGRSLDIDQYRALHQAIGTAYGSSAGRFNVPDLEGRFLRGASGGTAVGSVQEYATGRPRTALTVSVPNLPDSRCDTGGGARGGAAHVKGSKTIDPWSSGGNGDSRPVNLYLNFYIRAR
jgi:microcystin-dependent protein